MEDDLSLKISALPTIKDIDALLSVHLSKLKDVVREEFKAEQKERDDRISTLENTVLELKVELNATGVLLTKGDDLIVDDEVWSVENENGVVKDDLDFMDPLEIVPGNSVNVALRGKSTPEVENRLKEEMKSKHIKQLFIHAGSNSVPDKPPEA